MLSRRIKQVLLMILILLSTVILLPKEKVSANWSEYTDQEEFDTTSRVKGSLGFLFLCKETSSHDNKGCLDKIIFFI